ncbi:hypothetical protein DPMN_010923 [Dreissena polymorpha]|uniref:Uncharacterized protein n=1 Tax=Dreissena polymorpha TaxID=45954 RepID=A0A9D4N0S6_DREPO|nr:hypothetical protein DPMN_010923 [Dreissena polymorpha]
MLKLAQTDRQTNRPTDQQTGQKQYVPPYYSGGHKNAPPTGAMFFHRSYMKIGHEIFELDPDFIGTKLLTKFHEDRGINVASIECLRTNVNGQTDGWTTDKDRSQKLT